MPNNDIEIDFALNRVAGYCKPDRATLEQVTDVFCAYLKDNPAKRDGLPAIMFPDALKKAWPCAGR
jgi:Rap1a immunity proteins